MPATGQSEQSEQQPCARGWVHTCTPDFKPRVGVVAREIVAGCDSRGPGEDCPPRRRAPCGLAQNVQVHGQLAHLAFEPIAFFFRATPRILSAEHEVRFPTRAGSESRDLRPRRPSAHGIAPPHIARRLHLEHADYQVARPRRSLRTCTVLAGAPQRAGAKVRSVSSRDPRLCETMPKVGQAEVAEQVKWLFENISTRDRRRLDELVRDQSVTEPAMGGAVGVVSFCRQNPRSIVCIDDYA